MAAQTSRTDRARTDRASTDGANAARPRLPLVPHLGLLGKVVAALVAVALVAGGYALWPRHDSVHVTGEFTRAVGLFPGSDVRILGVLTGVIRKC